MQLQGGGGRQRGALLTDDNAADVRAGLRDAALHLPVGLNAPEWVIAVAHPERAHDDGFARGRTAVPIGTRRNPP
ncbi:hypothetical protein GCM10018966_035220 [Streptomyces yanii]